MEPRLGHRKIDESTPGTRSLRLAPATGVYLLESLSLGAEPATGWSQPQRHTLPGHTAPVHPWGGAAVSHPPLPGFLISLQTGKIAQVDVASPRRAKVTCRSPGLLVPTKASQWILTVHCLLENSCTFLCKPRAESLGGRHRGEVATGIQASNACALTPPENGGSQGPAPGFDNQFSFSEGIMGHPPEAQSTGVSITCDHYYF